MAYHHNTLMLEAGYIPLSQAAEMLKVDYKTVTRWIKAGIIQSGKKCFGAGQMYVMKSEVESIVAGIAQ